jgi:hypothetical protein
MPPQPWNGCLPHDAIEVVTYEELHQYLAKFADGELGLVLLIGRHGTAKTESAKRIIGHAAEERHREGDGGASRRVLYVEGHAQPFGLYCELWEHRDCPVILDDLDKLYAKPECVRLLKPLCSNQPSKRITWFTKATMTPDSPPPSFVTTSNVILITNEWRTLNANVRALEDRAIILHFAPGNEEVHRQVARWFDDQEVFDFIAEHLSCVPQISMRHYEKGRLLRRAGIADWRTRLLQMILPDKRTAIVASLQVDPAFQSDRERVEHFIQETGLSRPTYYRIKQALPDRNGTVPHIVLSLESRADSPIAVIAPGSARREPLS